MLLYLCSFMDVSNIPFSTLQIYNEPSDEPDATYRPSGLVLGNIEKGINRIKKQHTVRTCNRERNIIEIFIPKK